MSRIPPASIRLTSKTLNYAFTGTSNYYYSLQLKQNIALGKAINFLGKTLIFPTSPLKRGTLHTLQPAALPIFTQLRATKYLSLQLAYSQHWFGNKTLRCASAFLNLDTTSFLSGFLPGEEKAYPAPQINHYENLLNAVKSICKRSLKMSANKAPKTGFWDIKKSIAIQKHQLAKQTCSLLPKNSKSKVLSAKFSQRSGLTYDLIQQLKLKSLLPPADQIQHPVKIKPLLFVKQLCLFNGSIFKHTKNLKTFTTWPLFKTKKPMSRKNLFMQFCIKLVTGKNCHKKSNTLETTKIASLIKPKNFKKNKLKQFYGFQFLEELAPSQQCFLQQTSYISSLALKKTMVRDPWMCLVGRGVSKHPISKYLNGQLAQKQEELVIPSVRVIKKADVSKQLLFEYPGGLDISQVKQSVHTNVTPMISIVHRFNQPIKLNLFAFMEGGLPRGVKQSRSKGSRGFKAVKGVNNRQNRFLHKKAVLQPGPYETSDVKYKLGATRLKSVATFELGLSLDTHKAVRQTLSVRF